jgi:cytochrome c peroxidase
MQLKLATIKIVFVLLMSAVFSWPAAAENDAALVAMAIRFFGVLPEAMTSPQNPITPEKVSLGKTLFYETRISKDGTVSCSRCHLVGLYLTDALPVAIGNSCKASPRNAPTLLNAAAQISAHWIGSRTSVEDQARQALVNPVSFGMPSYDSAMNVLKSIPGYVQFFTAAFPGAVVPVSVENFASAIGSFERTLVTPGPLDAFVKGDSSALAPGQKKGMKDFVALGCASCHSGPYLGGQAYKKFGLAGEYWTYTKSSSIDVGRVVVTGDENDKYVFKVPVLRNVAMTAPYFHDGSVASLPDAVRIMAKTQLNKNLEGKQEENILDFLDALTGMLPASCLSIPVLPPAGQH